MTGQRVLGFDFLRGLCALAVGIYHTLYWSGGPHLYNVGLYGVYLFFVLSGASMVIAYRDRIADGLDIGRFLMLRWFRLAPLYFAVLAVSVLNKLDSIRMLDLGMNLGFLFGLASPAQTSLVIGGWSLGIEFLFYFLFPVMLSASASRWRLLGLALTLLIQSVWIHRLFAGSADFDGLNVQYTQMMSFLFYFLGGCVIGHWALDRHLDRFRQVSQALLWPIAGAVMLLVFFWQGGNQVESVTGLRGVLLPCACLILVVVCLPLQFPKPIHRVIAALGSISYGVYLIHPVIYFAADRKITKIQLDTLGAPRLALAIFACLALASVLAWTLDRWLEAPVRRFSKRRLS